jgi:hypothetical protein
MPGAAAKYHARCGLAAPHERKKIERMAGETQLLRQLNSNNPMNLPINDADSIYTFIRNDELAQGSIQQHRRRGNSGMIEPTRTLSQVPP